MFIMPIEKVGRFKEEKFRVRTLEEIGIIERAKDKYCDSNHNTYDFILEFFNLKSINPCNYYVRVKEGRIAISIESWNKITSYNQL